MVSPLIALMRNVIMTELQDVHVKELLTKYYFKFFICYMYETQALIKKSDVPFVLQILNGFDKKMNFTVDTFEDKKAYFSVLLIDKKHSLHMHFIKITMPVHILIITVSCHGN